MKITLEGLLKELSLRGIEYDANRVGRKPWSSAAESGPRGFGTLCEAIDFQLTVSSKAAEAPGGQEREITEAEIANFYKAGTKPWTTEIIDNQAVVWVLRSEAEAALTLAAPAAPSERADELVFTPEQVECLNIYQSAGVMHPFTCVCGKANLFATVRGWICPLCDYTQNWAHDFMKTFKSRAGLSSQEGNKMAKFRKKPVVIEAVQFTEADCWASWLENENFLGKFVVSGRYHPGNRMIERAWITIPTLEGNMTALVGDWIVTGVKGEQYPCKPDIFEMTYEPVPNA